MRQFNASEVIGKLRETKAEVPTPTSKRPSLNTAAAQAVDKLLNFYPPLEVNDPRAFIAGIISLFAQYPPELWREAIDPARGIPAKIKTLRSLAAIKEILDDLYEPIAMRLARERIASQKSLPRPERTPEQQAKINAQVARAAAHFGFKP